MANSYEGNINWNLELIDNFKVWKGNEITNPESDEYGNILMPYSENRERYIQLLNEEFRIKNHSTLIK